MFEHALDLAVLAFAQAHRQPAIGALLAIERRLDPGIAHAIDRHAFGEAVENGLIGFAIGAHAIAPEPAGRRQFENAREAAVIGQKQEALGIDVEPSDAHQPRRLGRMLFEIIEDRRAAFRVLMGGDEAARLVEKEEPCALTLRQGLAVDADLVGWTDRDGWARQRFAVDGNPSLRDPGLGIAARAEAGAGDDLGDAVGVWRLVGRAGGFCLWLFTIFNSTHGS